MAMQDSDVKWRRDSGDLRRALYLAQKREDDELMERVAWVRSVDRAVEHYRRVTGENSSPDVDDLLGAA